MLTHLRLFSGYQPYALPWGVRWSCEQLLSSLTSASCTPCPTTRRLHWCKRKRCKAQQPKQCRRKTLAATKPIGPSQPRHFQRTRRDQDIAAVEVLPHGWPSAAMRTAELLRATARLLQGEGRRDRLWQDQRGALRDLPLRIGAVPVLRPTLRGAVAQALRLALRSANPPTVRLGVKVNSASNFYMSAMRWMRVRKLSLNSRKEPTCLRMHHVIAMKQCVKWRSIPTTTSTCTNNMSPLRSCTNNMSPLRSST